MTATPITEIGAFVLGGDEKINEFRYPIDDTERLKRIAPTKKQKVEDPDNYFITNKDVRCINGGYVIPKNRVNEGVVVFMVASIRDVERGIVWARKTKYPGQVFGIHSGTVKDLKTIPAECWIFATDVIGQSITIPNLSCMIDFMKEYKPRVLLELYADAFEYINTLEIRTISKCTQKQRKGRLGRTRQGKYLQPEDLTAVMDFTTEPSVGPMIVLKLASLKIPLSTLKCHANEDMLSFLEKYQWLHPQEIAINPIWRNFIREMEGIGKCRIKEDMEEKLNLVIQIEGDPIWWYLNTVLSTEYKHIIMTDPKKSKKQERGEDQQFLRSIAKFFIEVKTEKEAEKTRCPNIIYSFLERLEEVEGVEQMLTEEYPSSVSSEVSDSKTLMISVPILGAIVMAVAGGNALLEAKSSRYVVEAVTMDRSSIAGVGKQLVEQLKTNLADEITGQSWTILFEQVKRWIIENFRKLKVKLGLSEIKDSSLNLNLDILMGRIMNYAGPVITTLGGFTFLSNLLGATAFGMMYRTLEGVLGAIITNVILSAFTAYLAVSVSLKSFGKTVFALIVGFVINGIYRQGHGKSILDDNSESSSAALRMVSSVVTGTLLASSLAGIPVASVGVSDFQISQGSNSTTVLLKQIYLLFVKSEKMNIGEHVAILGDTMYNLFGLGPTGALIGGALIASIFAIRQLYHTYLSKYAAEIRHGSENANAGLEMFRRMDRFDELALALLSSSAVLVKPVSIISILIHYLTDLMTGKEASLKESFLLGAGTNPIWLLAVKIFEVVSHHYTNNNRQNDSSMWYGAISSLISGSCAVLYYTTQKDSEICNVFMRYFNIVWHYVSIACKRIKGVIIETLSQVGNFLGNGVVESLRENIRGGDILIRKKEQSFRMVERPPIRGRSTTVNSSLFGVWKGGTGFTEPEILMLQSGAGQYDSNGNMNSDFIVSSIPDSVSVCKSMTLNRPFSFVQVQNQSLLDTVQSLIGIGENRDGVLIFPTTFGEVQFQHCYAKTESLTALKY